MSLTKNIKTICAAKGITIAELEQAAKLSENSIFRWDKNIPGVEKVRRVAQILQVSVDELLQETIEELL